MTPLPKRRHSSRRQGKRRAAIRLVLPELVECPNCHQPKRQHQACPACGHYGKAKPLATQTPEPAATSS